MHRNSQLHTTTTTPPTAFRREGGRGEKTYSQDKAVAFPQNGKHHCCCSTASVWLACLSNVIDFPLEICITYASLSKRLLHRRLHPQDSPPRVPKKKSRNPFQSCQCSTRSRSQGMQSRKRNNRSKSCPPCLGQSRTREVCSGGRRRDPF